MPHVDQYVSVPQAKAQLFDLIRHLQTRQDTVGITRDGVPTAVLLRMEHFEGLMEALDMLSDQKTIRPLWKSLQQAQSGRWETHESPLPARVNDALSRSVYPRGRGPHPQTAS